jgi:alpha/beta superfamily hydrolase
VEPVTFGTEDGVRLEGELRVDSDPPRGSAAICHPHPRHGGSKDHPVLWAVRNELAGRRGLATLLFNFRGTMGSAGSYGGGRDEIRDVRAAIGLVRERVPDLPTVLAGWSFGANVALRESLDDERVTVRVLIGIPLRPNDLELPALPEPTRLLARPTPTLFVAGEHDGYCPADELRDYAAAAQGVALIVEDTDHYFWRREREMAAMVGDWVDRVLEQ